MFNNIKYIVHKVAASNVAGEGPVFTVFKELISKAMMDGSEPDPTKPLNLPEFDANELVLFNTVENMLTPKNWQVGNATKINQVNFKIKIGNNWKIHREIIEEKNDSGEIEEVLEKSRGIWETATITEAPVPKAVSPEKYDANGNIVTKDVHVGMYKITFPNALNHHPQFNDASPGTPNYKPFSVDWYQGIIRIHTQENKKGKRKTLEVVKLENVGTAKPLVVYALDAQFPVDIVVEKHDPILTGKHQVNFYPGYRVYLSHNAPYHLKESSVLPGEGEGLKYSIFGLQASDKSYSYTSKIGQPVQFFAQEVIKPEIPLMANGAEFVYATRPDTFGKATFSLTTGFKHIPHGIQFFRSNDDAILKVLYKTATVKAIKEKLKDKDLDHKLHIVKRWQSLLSFDYNYSETFQTDGQFFIYPEDETGYRFPNPDNYYLYNAINDVLRYRNKNYGTNHKLLNLGNIDNDNDNGDIGKIKLTDVVIPALIDRGTTFDDAVTFKDFIKSVIFNVFTPLTEIPMIYEHIKNSTYKPIPKKQVIRDDDGTLLAPGNPKFDMAPMAKKLSEQQINELSKKLLAEAVKSIPKAKAAVLFTDFNLDGTSDNLYFYAIRELGNKMQLGEYSPVIGPIKLVNTKPPQSPDVRRVLPVLQNKILNILPGVMVEINAYPKVQNIKQIKLYRTLNPSKAQSIRTMDFVKVIDLEADDQLLNNIWKIKDEFEDIGYVPYSDPLYYRVTALREVQYVEGSNIADEDHPEITEYVPSQQSKLLISSIVENFNPESPTLQYSFDENSPSLIDIVILKWDKKVHNGQYHVYKMTNQGNWEKIHSFQANFEDVQLLLADTTLQNGSLLIQNEDGDSIYHHFKVIAENSIGMLSTEDKIMTIPNANNLSSEGGVGDMVIEYTNLIRK